MVDYPKDWIKRNLGELVHIQTGTKNNEDKVSTGKYPFYVRSAKVERIDTYSYDTEAILIPGEGNIGSIFHYINGKFDVHQRVYAITNFSELVNPFYVYWFMKRNFGVYAFSQTSKATVDSLRLPTFEKFEVFLPPLEEQKAIGETLSTFDQHIENLEKLIEKKKMIRDGAVEDLMSGKTRLEGFDGDWEITLKIGEVFNRVSGSKVTAEEMQNLNNPNGRISIYAGGDTKVKVNESCEQCLNIITDQVVIVQSRGIIDFIYSEEPCTFKNEFWGYVSNGSHDTKFLYYYFKYNLNDFRQAGEGRSSFPQISKKVTEEYYFPNIDIVEQRSIASVLSSMDEEIDNLQKEKEKLEKIKQGAMDDLLIGRVRLV